MDTCRASPDNHFKAQSKNNPKNITSPSLPNKSRSQLAKQMFQLLKKNDKQNNHNRRISQLPRKSHLHDIQKILSYFFYLYTVVQLSRPELSGVSRRRIKYVIIRKKISTAWFSRDRKYFSILQLVSQQHIHIEVPDKFLQQVQLYDWII